MEKVSFKISIQTNTSYFEKINYISWSQRRKHISFDVKLNLLVLLSIISFPAQLGGIDREDLLNFEISQVYRHENYSKCFENNVALVQLKELIPLSPEEFPICIYKDYGNISANEIFLAAGWGFDLKININNAVEEDSTLEDITEAVTYKESNILQDRMLSKSDEMNECINFKNEKLVKKNFLDYICTHGTNTQSFKFEKGASLMLLKNGEWILAGLLSDTNITTIPNNRFDTIDTSEFV